MYNVTSVAQFKERITLELFLRKKRFITRYFRESCCRNCRNNTTKLVDFVQKRIQDSVKHLRWNIFASYLLDD